MGEAAVVERPAELKHSPFSRFSKEPQIMSSQALKATVQQSVRMASQVSILQIPLLLKYKIKCKNYNDSNLGSRAAKSTRRRICLESRGEISFSIFFYLLSNIFSIFFYLLSNILLFSSCCLIPQFSKTL